MLRTIASRPSLLAAASISSITIAFVIVGCAEARRTEPVATNPVESEKPAAAAPAPAPVESVAAAASVAPPASATAAPAPPKEAPAEPRIWAKARFAWIHAEPVASRAWIGYLAPGTGAKLRGGSTEAAKINGGRDCDAWYAVEPRGFVCAGASATIDENDPALKILRRDAANISSPWPYQYGESQGAPRYFKLPTASDQRRAEPDLARHQELVEKARAAANADEIRTFAKHLVGMDLNPANQTPPELFNFTPLLREERKFIHGGSTVAYVREFDYEGRTYLLTWDQAIVPKDRVKPYKRSEFHGLTLGKDAHLPLAFFREKPRPKWKKSADGKLERTEATWPRHGWVELTGTKVEQDGKTFYETKESDVYVALEDAQVLQAIDKAPWLGEKNPDKQKWVDVSVLNGTLVAYEGLRPVYATMISPGRGGVPYEGIDPVKTASTPVGIFRVDGKFRTASMVSSSDENLVHSEVNWVLNFHGPHALHGAYWHDGWGEKKSGGCVNLAPIDAKWIFDWTDPPVPEGWYGLRAIAEFGPSTIVRVHR